MARADFALCHVSVALSQTDIRQAANSLLVFMKFDANSRDLISAEDSPAIVSVDWSIYVWLLRQRTKK